jgi:hypothetical protein
MSVVTLVGGGRWACDELWSKEPFENFFEDEGGLERAELIHDKSLDNILSLPGKGVDTIKNLREDLEQITIIHQAHLS